MSKLLGAITTLPIAAFLLVLISKNECSAEALGNDYSPRYMPICGNSKRVNCIVDGDTLWLDGIKMRLKSIDAPETGHHAECLQERAIAAAATAALQGMISDRDLTVQTFGTGRFGRLLVSIHSSCGINCLIDAGQSLLDSDLAHSWPNTGNRWCGR